LTLVTGRIGYDVSGYPLDGPVPPPPPSEGGRTFHRVLYDMARQQNMTLRDLYNLTAAARGHWVICGTPTGIADTLEEWFAEGAADGYNILPAYFPGAFADFVDLVVRDSSTAASCAATTRARLCATISACPGRRRRRGCAKPPGPNNAIVPQGAPAAFIFARRHGA